MAGLSVVTWKWGAQYPAEFVNRLARAVDRNLVAPHRFICVTDDMRGLDPRIDVIPDRGEYAKMAAGSRSCYRRLRMFDADARGMFGDHLLHLDLDTVIVGPLDPLIDRPEELVMWRQPQARIPLRHGYAYNPSIMLMRVGSHDALWKRFHGDPDGTVAKARAAGWFGSDMAVINFYLMDKKIGAWTEGDGVLSWWVHIRKEPDMKWKSGSPRSCDGSLPAGARVVHFHGSMSEGPGDPGMQARYPWIKEHWR